MSVDDGGTDQRIAKLRTLDLEVDEIAVFPGDEFVEVIEAAQRHDEAYDTAMLEVPSIIAHGRALMAQLEAAPPVSRGEAAWAAPGLRPIPADRTAVRYRQGLASEVQADRDKARQLQENEAQAEDSLIELSRAWDARSQVESPDAPATRPGPVVVVRTAAQQDLRRQLDRALAANNELDELGRAAQPPTSMVPKVAAWLQQHLPGTAKAEGSAARAAAKRLTDATEAEATRALSDLLAEAAVVHRGVGESLRDAVTRELGASDVSD